MSTQCHLERKRKRSKVSSACSRRGGQMSSPEVCGLTHSPLQTLAGQSRLPPDWSRIQWTAAHKKACSVAQPYFSFWSFWPPDFWSYPCTCCCNTQPQLRVEVLCKTHWKLNTGALSLLSFTSWIYLIAWLELLKQRLLQFCWHWAVFCVTTKWALWDNLKKTFSEVKWGLTGCERGKETHVCYPWEPYQWLCGSREILPSLGLQRKLFWVTQESVGSLVWPVFMCLCRRGKSTCRTNCWAPPSSETNSWEQLLSFLHVGNNKLNPLLSFKTKELGCQSGIWGSILLNMLSGMVQKSSP